MAQAYFYSNTSNEKFMNKSINLISGPFNVEIVEPCTEEEPNILVNSDKLGNLPITNYFYLTTFGRYYYIAGKTITNNNMLIIKGSVDPLMSFNGYILNKQYLIGRNEYVYNEYIADTYVTPRVERQISKKVIGNVGNTASFALTCTGGEG